MNRRTSLLLVAICCAAFVALAPVTSSAESPAGEGATSAELAESTRFDALSQRQLLERALEYYREIERRGGWGKVPTDLVMGEGNSYDCRRIDAIERRLVAEGYLGRLSPRPLPPPPPGQKPSAKAAAPQLQRVRYDEPLGLGGPCPWTRELTEAMRAYQADRKILGVGQLGSQTMTQLNRPVDEVLHTLRHDVERWRNVSLDPSGTFILVNIPFYELSVFERGEEVLRIPVIVGLPSWPTPTFSSRVQSMVVNPDWGIPPNIAKAEYLPFARKDPNYLARQGITNDGGSLRQKPGPNNPLGRIKFLMPNPHDVYLHDTPYKKAFTAKVKALSHGCVRLSRPLDLANHLLRDSDSWDRRRLDAAIASRRTQQINLDRPIPVHIVYSTSRVNEEGRLEMRADVYGRNKGRRYAEDESELRPDESLIDSGP